MYFHFIYIHLIWFTVLDKSGKTLFAYSIKYYRLSMHSKLHLLFTNHHYVI